MEYHAPGSKAALLEVSDRILRLTLNDQVQSSLPASDLDGLQHRAQETLQTLALSDASAQRSQLEVATPALCGLAVACVSIVETAELTTGLARLVAAGCEVLAALLLSGLCTEDTSHMNGSFPWVHDALEELSDQMDFLALEVYCGLGRLEVEVRASNELPIVPDHVFDRFESYWGSIEHRQALQQVSTWLLCVVFRALGYASVSAQRLMEFANHDLLCLCALLQGLLAANPSSGGLPHDLAEIQVVAISAICGLTSPDLAFPYYSEEAADTIEDQNRILGLYKEVLCAAIVESGLLEVALERTISYVQSGADYQQLGVQFLGFLAAVVKQTVDVLPTSEDPSPPALRLRAAVLHHADVLGSLLHATIASPLTGAVLRQLLTSCSELAVLVSADNPDDAFTLECRMLIETLLDSGCVQDADLAAVLAALTALAANVGDLQVSKGRISQMIACLTPEQREHGRARFSRRDSLTVRGGKTGALELFSEPWQPQEAVPPVPLDAAPMPSAAPARPGPGAGSLRDIVENAPEQFRCAIDRKMLVDPVVSPAGVVFERSTLSQWLQAHGSVCPITGGPLRLEDCRRAPDIRKQVTDWARSVGKARKANKKNNR